VAYAPVVREHLEAIERKYYPLIRSTIETQLRFEPDVEARNRKPLKRSITAGGDWEIRFGPKNRFRVFYEVKQERNEVHILAVGVKIGNRLFIAGKEVQV
jgi:mRNA-degrading endonuclease RelE of RelBE toxin-antitoxin system